MKELDKAVAQNFTNNVNQESESEKELSNVNYQLTSEVMNL